MLELQYTFSDLRNFQLLNFRQTIFFKKGKKWTKEVSQTWAELFLAGMKAQ
jgi:hypothetical protein